jgi:tetratricopeptide (TPR) repeat protein
MTRWVAASAATLISLLTGLAAPPQDPKPGHETDIVVGKVVDDQKIVVGKAVDDQNQVVNRVVVVTDDDAEPHAQLVRTFETLARLKSQKLEGRQKELLDRAVKLYKQAIDAYGKDDEAQTRIASARARAALELSRTVERLANLRRGDRPDPDLPPPPPPRAMKPFAVADLAQVEGVQVPPAITIVGHPVEEKTGDDTTTTISVTEADAHKGGTITLRGAVSVDADNVQVFTPETLGLPKAIGGSIRLRKVEGKPIEIAGNEINVNVEEVAVARLQKELAQQAKKIAAEARNQAEKAKGFEFRFRTTGPDAGSSLKDAYDTIQKARESLKDDADSAFYLDAAKELYNAARKEAEAGRFERAAELSRAAITLTKVPSYLSDKPGKADDAHPDQAGRRSVEVRKGIRIRRETRKEGDKATPKVEVRIESEDRTPDQTKDDSDDHKEGEHSNQPTPEASADDKPVGGVGVQFAFEEGGKLRVLSVLPDSPAGKDGSIQPGSFLTGVEEDGKLITFESMEQPEIVSHLRGEPGSTVRIQIRGDDDDAEPKLVTLTRAVIHVGNESDAAKASEDVQRALRDLPAQIQRQLELKKPAPTEIPPELP